MALYNKIGSLMRQSISQTTVSNGHMTGPSMYNAFRCMSSKLFVGGLSYQTDDYSLKEAFSGFGEVVEARVITDRESGRSKGFGFVSYNTEDSAKEAMSAMDGQELNGRSVRVSLATERAPRTGGYGGGGGGGGFNRGYGNADAGNDQY
nr:glycine-rich RNA-binding protein 4, mitochondrial-like [Tanacetum cinerariifolium]